MLLPSCTFPFAHRREHRTLSLTVRGSRREGNWLWSDVFILLWFSSVPWKHYFKHLHHLIRKIITSVVFVNSEGPYYRRGQSYASFTKDSCFSGSGEVHWGFQSTHNWENFPIIKSIAKMDTNWPPGWQSQKGKFWAPKRSDLLKSWDSSRKSCCLDPRFALCWG